VRATRLRYVPTACTGCSVSLAFEKGQDGEEFFVQIEEKSALSLRGCFAPGRRSVSVRGRTDCAAIARSGCVGGCAFGVFAMFLAALFEMFARAGDGEALFVEEALDFENSFDVFAAVKAMAAGALYRLQHGKFGFPIAQDEGLCGRQAADFADAK
jgi:hypothetical protein